MHALSSCCTVPSPSSTYIAVSYTHLIDENNVIQDAKFKTFGCGAAIATSSMATVLVKGKTVQEALKAVSYTHLPTSSMPSRLSR